MEGPRLNLTMKDFIWPYEEPPVFEAFWFEKFNVIQCRLWMEKNWTISVYICTAYLLLLYFGKKIMKQRQAFDLQKPLTYWNAVFALFSLIGLIRCTPELARVLQGPNGFHRSVCVRDGHNEPAAFWAWAFVLSKVVELGDTVFIVLKKKPLHFVHYFHHSVSLLMCWGFYSHYEPIFRYFGVLNYFVHSILYGYLFLKTINIHTPKIVTQLILFMELFQMIVGVVVNSYAIWIKMNGQPCEHRTDGIIVQMLLYLSFVIIFACLFFHDSQKISRNVQKKQKST